MLGDSLLPRSLGRDATPAGPVGTTTPGLLGAGTRFSAAAGGVHGSAGCGPLPLLPLAETPRSCRHLLCCRQAVEKRMRQTQLLIHAINAIDALAETSAIVLAFAVPGNMLARHTHAGVLPIKII